MGVFQDRFHIVGVCHEIRRQVAPVELHPLNHVQFGFDAFGLFDRNHSVFPYLLHCFRDKVPDGLVVIRGGGGNLGDIGTTCNGLTEILNGLDRCVNRFVDTPFEVHRVRSGRHILETFPINGLCENCSRGGPVTGNIRSLG